MVKMLWLRKTVRWSSKKRNRSLQHSKKEITIKIKGNWSSSLRDEAHSTCLLQVWMKKKEGKTPAKLWSNKLETPSLAALQPPTLPFPNTNHRSSSLWDMVSVWTRLTDCRGLTHLFNTMTLHWQKKEDSMPTGLVWWLSHTSSASSTC